MKRKVVLLVVAVAGIASYVAYRVYRWRAPLEWSGTVEAHTIEVGSRVGGRIQTVRAREGDVVQAGQTLITLEPWDLPAQRLQAQGALTEARAQLDKVAARSLPTQRRAEIAEAEARLKSAETAQEKARQDAERTQKLFAAGAATRVDATNTDLAHRTTAAETGAARAQLDRLLRGTPEDVRSAEGAVDSAAGRLQQIDVMIDELAIRAPRHARVEALDLRPGDILAPNAPAVLLLEPGELFVRVYVPETEIGHIRPGLEVPILVDSFPGRRFRGRVESVAHQGEFTPRNLQTENERADQLFASRVRIEEGADVLRAGMAAFVRVAK